VLYGLQILLQSFQIVQIGPKKVILEKIEMGIKMQTIMLSTKPLEQMQKRSPKKGRYKN